MYPRKNARVTNTIDSYVSVNTETIDSYFSVSKIDVILILLYCRLEFNFEISIIWQNLPMASINLKMTPSKMRVILYNPCST